MSNKSFPKLAECKDLKQAEAIKYLNKVLDQLEILKSSESIYDPIQRISLAYFDYYDHFIDDVCELLLRRGIIKFLYNYLNSVSKSNYANDKTVNQIFTLLINYSDHSKQFAKVIETSKILELVVDILLNADLSLIGNKDIKEFVYDSCIIVNNFARDPDNIFTYKIEELKTCISKFLKIDPECPLGIISILILSYLVDEEDRYLLDEGSNAIKNLLKQMKFTLNTKTRSDGFTLYEMCHGLLCMSRNDNLKDKIYEEGGIPIIIDILKKRTDRELEPTLDIIDHLSFKNKIKDKLIKEFHIEEVLKQLENDESETIKKCIKGIRWNLYDKSLPIQDEKTINRSVSKDKFVYDIFISYCHANQEQIIFIRNYLLNKNINAWIDSEELVGSCLESMAKGIERSAIFLMAISQQYKRSPNCRREAEYAARMNKRIVPLMMQRKYKPNSWLGIITGSAMYYEFSGHCNSKEEIKKLHDCILKSLDSCESSDDDVVQDNQKSERISIKCCKVNENLKSWTNDKVSNWLEKSKLGHLKKQFVNIDGSLLCVMLDLRSNSSEYFNNSLKKEFGMKFVDVLIFHRALDNLCLDE